MPLLRGVRHLAHLWVVRERLRGQDAPAVHRLPVPRREALAPEAARRDNVEPAPVLGGGGGGNGEAASEPSVATVARRRCAPTASSKFSSTSGGPLQENHPRPRRACSATAKASWFTTMRARVPTSANGRIAVPRRARVPVEGPMRRRQQVHSSRVLGTPSRAGDAPTNSRTDASLPSTSASRSRGFEPHHVLHEHSFRFADVAYLREHLEDVQERTRPRVVAVLSVYAPRVRLARRRRRPHVGGAEVELDLLTGYVLDVPAQRRRRGKFAEYPRRHLKLSIAATPGTRWVPRAFWSAQSASSPTRCKTRAGGQRPSRHPVGTRHSAWRPRNRRFDVQGARLGREHRIVAVGGHATRRPAVSRARRGACRRAGRCGRGSFQVFGRGDERDGRTR